jgi:hypothetical protein
VLIGSPHLLHQHLVDPIRIIRWFLRIVVLALHQPDQAFLLQQKVEACLPASVVLPAAKARRFNFGQCLSPTIQPAKLLQPSPSGDLSPLGQTLNARQAGSLGKSVPKIDHFA